MAVAGTGTPRHGQPGAARRTGQFSGSNGRNGSFGSPGHDGPRGTRAIRPVERPVPLRHSVYEALVELIVGGGLQPGEHLVESDLARQLGVSRQPVREALHRLEAEGWVDLRPSQGAFVHVPTDREVDQLLDVRELLEAETARLAARSVRQGATAELRAIWQDGMVAAEAGDFDHAAAA